jgi:hypothetical protein
LDRIAAEVEQVDPRLALAIDMISDQLEGRVASETPVIHWEDAPHAEQVKAEHDGFAFFENVHTILVGPSKEYSREDREVVEETGGEISVVDEKNAADKHPKDFVKLEEHKLPVYAVMRVKDGQKVKKGDVLFEIYKDQKFLALLKDRLKYC